jgi:hypothetical protein
MSVEFIDPSQTPGFILKQSHPGNESRGLIGFLIKRGIVNNEAQANYLLLGFSAILILITAYLLFGYIKKASVPVLTAAQAIERTKEMEKLLLQPK